MGTVASRFLMGVAILSIVILASVHSAEGRMKREVLSSADTAAPTDTVRVNFKTLQKPGIITVRFKPDSSAKISLMKYRVEGSVLQSKITGIVIDSGASMMLMKITPVGSYPPFTGPLPVPGIADQPVQVVIMSN